MRIIGLIMAALAVFAGVILISVILTAARQYRSAPGKSDGPTIGAPE